jgi:hypothetical protein
VESVAVCHTGEVYLNVPRDTGENDDSRRSAISRSGSIATCYELRERSSTHVWRVAMLARCLLLFNTCYPRSSWPVMATVKGVNIAVNLVDCLFECEINMS